MSANIIVKSVEVDDAFHRIEIHVEGDSWIDRED